MPSKHSYPELAGDYAFMGGDNYAIMAVAPVLQRDAIAFRDEKNMNVYDINDALTTALSGSHKTGDLKENMEALCLLNGAKDAKDLQRMIAEGSVSVNDIAQQAGLSGAQMAEFGKVLGVANGVRDGSIIAGSGMGIGFDNPYVTPFGASKMIMDQWYGSNPLPMNDTKFNELIKTANDWIGTPYTFPGNDRNGVDCSHFVNNVYGEAGMPYEYKRSAEFQNAPEFSEITKDDLRRGDVIVWQTTNPKGKYEGHVALYVNEGPGKQLLHSYGGNGVGYTSNYVRSFYESKGYQNIQERYFRYKK